MDKREFEFKKEILKTKRFEIVAGILKFALAVSAVIYAIKIIFDGLKPFIGQSPASIEAFAKLLNSINIANISAYILSAGMGAAWYIERTGKKRAIRDKSLLQKQIESKDAYRSSSGLTEIGDTPEG